MNSIPIGYNFYEVNNMEKIKKDVNWITRLGLLLACLIVVQVIPFPAPFKQFITGPLVNMILLIAAISTGLFGGMIIAVLSPILVLVLGTHSALGFLLPVVPFIMLGNITYVFFFYLLRGKNKQFIPQFFGLIFGSFVKFLILFVAVTYIVKVPAPIAKAMGIVQLYTAIGGGILAILISKTLESNKAWN